MPQNTSFFSRTYDLLVSQKRTQTLFFHHPSPFPCNFCNLQQWWHLYCFAILGSTSIIVHSVKQHLLRKRPLVTFCAKDYKGHSLMQTSFSKLPNSMTCVKMAPKICLFCCCQYQFEWRHLMAKQIRFWFEGEGFWSRYRSRIWVEQNTVKWPVVKLMRWSNHSQWHCPGFFHQD